MMEVEISSLLELSSVLMSWTPLSDWSDGQSRLCTPWQGGTRACSVMSSSMHVSSRVAFDSLSSISSILFLSKLCLLKSLCEDYVHIAYTVVAGCESRGSAHWGVCSRKQNELACFLPVLANPND
jgi:hypothetical protein